MERWWSGLSVVVLVSALAVAGCGDDVAMTSAGSAEPSTVAPGETRAGPGGRTATGATGELTSVCLSADDRIPAPIPNALRAALEPHRVAE